MTELAQLETLVDDFEYENDDKTIVLTLSLRTTFYFWGGHTDSVRSALTDCIEAYQSRFGAELKWGYQAEGRSFPSYQKLPSLRSMLAKLDRDDQIEWHVSSADNTEACGHYEISALTERGWQSNQISVVTFLLPREYAFEPEKQKTVLELIELFAVKLKPFHGHSGLCATSVYEQYQYQPDEFDVATKFRGIYIEDMTIDSNETPRGIKGVDWLTYIGKDFAERVGGLPVLLKRLQADAIDHRSLSDGVLIATGLKPEIVPVAEENPESVVKVNAVLRPFRNGSFGGMAFGSSDGILRFTRYLADLWMRRFDQKDIWPPALKLARTFPKAPACVPPEKKVKLKSGEACTVHGRYSLPKLGFKFDDEKNDPVAQVVLLPGDIAPYWLALGPHGELKSRDAVTWELRCEL